MAKQILFPLKRDDRIEDLIPFLEELAKPGMRVVFLVPYPVESWLYLKDHWVTTESPREATLAGRKIMDRYSWEVQKGLAEQKVAPAREVLQKVGMEVGVDLYTGSLRKVIEDCTANGDAPLIMMRAGSGHPLMRLLSRTILPFGLFKRPSSPPIVLLHPNDGI